MKKSIKSILIISVCAVLLAFSPSVYSAEGPYVSGNIGLAMPIDSDVTISEEPGVTGDLESDKGLALGVAVGYGFGNIRAEGEIAYQKNDLDKISVGGESEDLTGDTSSLAFLLNGYYDFKNKSAFTPFISAGLGLARVEVSDDEGDDENDTVFAYQVGAGVGYAINEKVTLDLKYRYFATSDPEFDGVEIEYSSHNFYAGIRVAF